MEVFNIIVGVATILACVISFAGYYKKTNEKINEIEKKQDIILKNIEQLTINLNSFNTILGNINGNGNDVVVGNDNTYKPNTIKTNIVGSTTGDITSKIGE